jgi:hypothetical protein
LPRNNRQSFVDVVPASAYWRWQPARTRNMWLESNSQNWLRNFPRTRSSLMSW